MSEGEYFETADAKVLKCALGVRHASQCGWSPEVSESVARGEVHERGLDHIMKSLVGRGKELGHGSRQGSLQWLFRKLPGCVQIAARRAHLCSWGYP